MFNFTVKEFLLGGDTGTPTLQFYKRGFELNGNNESPSWQDIILSGNTALTLTNALANGLNYLKLFGNTEQRNIPSEYTQVNSVANTAQTLIDTGVKFDLSKNYEIELKVRGVVSSWYILQARESQSSTIYGISGSQTNDTIILAFNGANINTTQVTRVTGNIYYIKATINNGNLTLYVKDETADTEETVTGNYTVTTGQSVNICLFGNSAGQYVGIDSDVYFARIKENGNYIMNYVPCRQNATAGFYDKASNTFKTTTNLSAGADVVPSPDTPMDIVCNNGALKLSPNLFNKNLVPNANEYINKGNGNTDTPASGEFRHSDYITIKGNTRYYVGIINSTANSAGLAFYDDTKTYISGISLTELGNNNNIITSPANTRYIKFSFRTDEGYNTNWQNTVYFVEGNQPLAEFIPYGIYTDGTTETVSVHGKNLFGGYTIGTGYWQSGGTWSTDSNYNSYQYITLKPNTTYTISNDVAPDYWRLTLFNGNTFSSRLLQQSGTSYTFTTSASENKISIAFNKNNIPDVSKVQLEQGFTATTYEPYYNGGSATAEMLLKVGDYQDVQSIIDGAVTRNVGVLVLNGTESWVKAGETYAFALSSVQYNYVINKPVICNQYPYKDTITSNLKNIIANTSGTYALRILVDDTVIDISSSSNEQVTAFKQYLADQYANGTPVIVVYPLATPTTETVTPQPLSIQAGTNIITAQGSIDNLGLEVSYKATV